VLVALVVVLPLHLLALRAAGLRPAMALRQAARPLLFAVLAGGAAYACTLGTTGRVFALVTLTLGGCAGVLVYAAGIAPKYRHVLLARRGRSGRLPAVPAAG
jgi:hypothetical protein